MQSLFLTEKDVFEIKIFIGEEEGLLYCDLSEDGVKTLLNTDNYDIEEHTIKFKKPSFGDVRALTDILLAPKDINGVLSYDTNPIGLKVKTMSFLLRDWDFTDGEGNKIPPTEESILNLNPLIAAAISLQLEDYISEEEETDTEQTEEKSE